MDGGFTPVQNAICQEAASIFQSKIVRTAEIIRRTDRVIA